MKPLLSICIPTYNRCLWLYTALWNWLPQVKQLEGVVELIVSDNGSSDATAAVAHRAQTWGPFRYYRNDTNLGTAKNCASIVKLAQGEFIWLVGDDDIPRLGTLQKSTEVLKTFPSLKYVFINYTMWAPAGPPLENLRTDKINLTPAGNTNLQIGFVKKAVDLIEGHPSCFLGTFETIWHNSLAIKIFGSGSHELCSSLLSVATHAVYIADHLLNKPAYYIGYPYIISSYTTTSWQPYAPIIHLKWTQELHQKFINNGAPRSAIMKFQKFFLLLYVAQEDLRLMLTNKNTPLRNRFSLWFFLKQNWHFNEFYRLLFVLAIRALKFIIRRTMKNILNILRQILRSFSAPDLESLPDTPILFHNYRNFYQCSDLKRKPGGWIYKEKFYPDYITVGGQGHAIFREAIKFCKGLGADIGVGLSSSLPGAVELDIRQEPGAGKNISDFADNSLDYIFSSHCLVYIKNWKKALGEWVKKIKQGGIIFLYLPHPDCAIWHPGSPFAGDGHKWIAAPNIIRDALIEAHYNIVSFDDGPDAMQSFYVCGQKLT